MGVFTPTNRNNLTAGTGRGRSPALWSRAKYINEMNQDNGWAIRHFDDFVRSHDLATNNTTVVNSGPYEMYTGNGTSLAITGGAGLMGGVQTIVSGTTADVNAVITLGGGSPFKISTTAGSNYKLLFETRVKISSVTDADQVQWFVGLTEEDRTAANGVFADAGGDLGFTSTIDLIGFARFDNDGDSISFVYQLAGQTPVDVCQIACVADTYIKLGFLWDPKAPTANRIVIFADNQEQTTYVTGTAIAGTAFPLDQGLTPTICVQNDATTSNTLSVDWWDTYQECVN